jgi:hypothetical protein
VDAEYEQLELGPFVRSDDLPAARVAAALTVAQEGDLHTLKPGTHRHLTLRVYAAAEEELTATEAGRIATPGHDRVTGGTRRTYDLRALKLVVRGERGYRITDKGRIVLRRLDRGQKVTVST